MKTQISFRDVEQLSAYLDGQLSQAEVARLEVRIKTDSELAATLDDLRQAKSILRRTPQRRAPRNFTLTPRMAGIRPPLPRAVPALSWASAVAVLMFLFTLGGNLVGRFSFGAAAPMMAAAPEVDMATGYGGGGPVATEAPVQENAVEVYGTATPETFVMTVPEVSEDPGARIVGTADELAAAKTPELVNPWLVIWPALAVLLAGAALFLRWLRQLSFSRRLHKK